MHAVILFCCNRLFFPFISRRR